jgi:ferritin-like metal-binding protein YciE
MQRENNMKMNSLADLMVEQLQDVYDAEHQIVEALPKMVKAASSTELKSAFEEHRGQSQQHIKRLEDVFKMVGQTPKRKTCKAMKGLITEGDEMIEANASATVRDAGLIAAAQRVEHYEMAGYGTLRTFAHQLGHTDAAQLLQETLDEEEVTDKKLSQLANTINIEAVK